MIVEPQEPISVPQTEREQVRRLDRALSSGAAAVVDPSGQRIELPATIYAILRKIVALMAHDRAITLVPDEEIVTTQRAADILGVSRPFFVRLLETGAMPHHRVGNQRRVYLRDVLAFARKRDEERHAALDRLTRDAFDAGLYDQNSFPEGGQDE